MSSTDSNQPFLGGSTPPQTAGVTDVVTELKGIVSQLSALVTATKSIATAIAGRVTFGTFTLSAGASTTVAQPMIQSNSTVSLTPTNAAATNLQRTSGLYVSAIVAGTSFTVTTGTGSAAGTETFSYTINTPT